MFKLLGTVRRELRDCHKVFDFEFDPWHWGVGLLFDANLDPGFDWTWLLFTFQFGPVWIQTGLIDND